MGNEALAPLAATWSSEPSEALKAEVRRVAARWGLPVYERPWKRGLSKVIGAQARAFLVRTERGWTLLDGEGALGVSPGLAMLRLKRLAGGAPHGDPLLAVAGIRPGETIVDATVGLGADARVLAAAAGPAGRVVGLEASLPLAVLLAEGLALEPPWPHSAPITVHHGRAEAWLASAPDRSADVVYFDPMFTRHRRASPAFSELRRFAEPGAPSPSAIDEATRVARRLVLMKSADPRLFPPLGLEPVTPARNAVVFWGRRVLG